MPAVAVVRDVDRHALTAQTAGDRIRQIALVLDHQNSHCRSRCRSAPPTRDNQGGPGGGAFRATVAGRCTPRDHGAVGSTQNVMICFAVMQPRYDPTGRHTSAAGPLSSWTASRMPRFDIVTTQVRPGRNNGTCTTI